ncbi:MAG: hypothetical protein LWW93_03955 [Hyphomicrobiales bacterium]|nr:hypothetical protein [Hyphomicrobiales bacterium]
MRWTIGAAVLSFLSSSVGAAGADCDFRAWSKDPDPAGLAVRAKPDGRSAVLARLPPPRLEGGERFAVEVRVIGSRDGWMLIDRGEFVGYVLDGKTVFTGRGWVSGRMLETSIQDERVRAAPETIAAVRDAPRRTASGEEGELLRLDRILACAGRWIEIEGRFSEGEGAGRATRGWVTGLCGNQVTTCP